MIIGAALDFGGGVVEGVGQLFTEKEKRFEQNVSLDSEQGKITLARSSFSLDKIEGLVGALEKKFEQNQWHHAPVQKKRRIGHTLFLEKWNCQDAQGNEFELSILREKNKDTQVSVESVGQGIPNSRSTITTQIYTWLKEASLGTP